MRRGGKETSGTPGFGKKCLAKVCAGFVLESKVEVKAPPSQGGQCVKRVVRGARLHSGVQIRKDQRGKRKSMRNREPS